MGLPSIDWIVAGGAETPSAEEAADRAVPPQRKDGRSGS
jgi:hypothetical protein